MKKPISPQTVIRKQRFTISQLSTELSDLREEIISLNQRITSLRNQNNDQVASVTRARVQADTDRHLINNLTQKVAYLESELAKSRASSPRAYSSAYSPDHY